MKKLLAILLTLCMLIGAFAGCSDDADETGSQSGGKKPSNKTDSGISLDVEYATLGEASKKVDAKVPEGGKHVQSISAEESTLYIEIGTLGQIKTTIVPADASDQSIYYESDNEEIVKVDANGQILGVEAGCATVTATTNDRNFKAKVRVYVYRVENDAEKVTEMLGLINAARVDAGLSEMPVSEQLNAAATARAFEEAAEQDGKMDDVRPIKNADGENKSNSTVFSDFDIYARGSTRIYVWDSFDNVQAAYDAIVKNEDNKNVLLSDDSQYSYIGAGCYQYEKVTYWCILMYLK